MSISSQTTFSGLKVLEVGEGVSAPYCGKIFSGSGADVIKIEKPGKGDRARYLGPFPGDNPGLEQSGLFLYLNMNKRGVTLNLEAKKGRELFKQLVAQCDILLENGSPWNLKEIGLGYEVLSQLNQSLIMTAISPFGQEGPYQNFKGNDLVCSHMSGLAYRTPDSVPDPSKFPPLKLGGNIADFNAGATAAVATLIALFRRKKGGTGTYVDISEQEALASWLRSSDISAYFYDPEGMYKERFANRAALPLPVGAYSCKDGFVMVGTREEVHFRQLFEMIFGTEWEKNEKLTNVIGEQFDIFSAVGNWAVISPMVSEWFKQHTKEEIFEMAISRRLPITPCNDAEEIWNSPQFSERQWFMEVNHPMLGKMKLPGPAYKLASDPSQVCPAPMLGEHNKDIFVDLLGFSNHDMVKLYQGGVI